VASFLRAPVPHFIGDAVRTIRLFAIRLPDADGKRSLAVLAIVHKPKIGFDFAREEELVRWRQKSQRPAARFHDPQPIARFHRDSFRIDRAAERVLLPRARHIAPD
jgi:hypothetical protein